MKKRVLGRTGIYVSEIGFGGVEIGLPYGIGVSSKADMPTAQEAIQLLHSATDHGINFFDTARMYGASEQIMGEAFKDRRDRVVICTKCRHFRDKQGALPPSGQLKKSIESSLQESLEALQTGYIDLYMMHQVDPEILDNEVVAETFLNLKKKGMVRATGVSTYTLEETKMAIESGAWDVIQLPFNLMDQSHARYFSLALQQGVGITIRSVLFKGILSEKGRNLHPALKDVERHVKLYGELLDESIPDLPNLAIKFALSHQQVASVLVGIDRMEYMQESLQAANGIYLDNNKLARAKELSYPDPVFLNLPYWDKMNWLR